MGNFLQDVGRARPSRAIADTIGTISALKSAETSRALDMEKLEQFKRLNAVQEKEQARLNTMHDVSTLTSNLPGGENGPIAKAYVKHAEGMGYIDTSTGGAAISTENLEKVGKFLMENPAYTKQANLDHIKSLREQRGKAMQVLSEKPDDKKALQAKQQLEAEIASAIGNDQGLQKEMIRLETVRHNKASEGKYSLQRKTKTFIQNGQTYSQDYNFDPTTGNESPVGKPYLSKKESADSTSPTSTPGMYYDKKDKKYYVNDDNGKAREVSTSEAQQIALKYKEEIPTSMIRDMQQSVPAVLGLINQTREAIKKTLAGPLAGRWKNLWSGKVGASDKNFRTLKTSSDLLITRLMRMHVGARGGQYIMEHFKTMIDAGKDSPENMKAALDAIEIYANETSQSIIRHSENKTTAPQQAIDMLKGNPKLADQFKAKYGYLPEVF